MKIGMILDSLFPSDERVEKEAVSLAHAGHNIDILSYSYGKLSKIENYKNITIVRNRFYKFLTKKLKPFINTPIDVYSKYWSLKIKNFVTKNDIDVIHVHDLYLLGAALKAKNNINKNIRIVADLHENYAHAIKNYTYSNSFPLKYIIPFKKWIVTEKKWLAKVDKIVAVVEEMRNRISEFCNPNDIYVVPNYIDNNIVFNDYKRDNNIINKLDDYFTISYIGSFDRHKGLDTLIGSLKYIDNISNIKVVIVGNGRNMNKLKEYAAKYNVQNNILFEGWVSHNLLPNYYLNTDIFCIPHIKAVQTDNSSPGKLFRYMASGKPVIVSNCDSIARIVKDSKSGLVFESKNEQDLAYKISLLYKNNKQRKEMGLKGKKAIKNKYNWDSSKKELIRLYKDIEM